MLDLLARAAVTMLLFLAVATASNEAIGHQESENDFLLPAPGASGECVILLHGLVRTSRSMRKIRDALERDDYVVINIDYPSRQQRIEVLSHDAVLRGIQDCRDANVQEIHFVTHSLGGILVRYYLALHELPELGRVVMLGPPNQGSEVVDAWRNVPGYFLINGPAGNQLGTDVDSIPKQLGPVSFPVGIIAGTRSINLILSLWLPNPDDGKVSVAGAKVEGMADFITLPTAHPFLPTDERVIAQVVSFLKTGGFDHQRAARERDIAEQILNCANIGELAICD